MNFYDKRGDLSGDLGLQRAGVAVYGRGEGGVHEHFSHFLGQETDVESFCNHAGGNAADKEEELPEGDAGAPCKVDNGGEVAFTEECQEA